VQNPRSGLIEKWGKATWRPKKQALGRCFWAHLRCLAPWGYPCNYAKSNSRPKNSKELAGKSTLSLWLMRQL